MRIKEIQSFNADGGWRPFSFLKMTTDEDLVGWSEYSCGPWSPALPHIIRELGQQVIGQDPRNFSVLRTLLSSLTRFAPGGLNCQAIAAIENAAIDVAAKAAGMSVYQLFGGALRTEIDLYWTHCGSFRVRSPDLFERLMNRERLIDLNGMQRLGKEVAASGFRAAKTNPILFNADGATLLNPGFVPEGLDHAGTISHEILVAIEAQMEAFRDGAGWSTELMLDVNFAYSPPSVAQLEACIRQFSLRWLEYDHRGAANLADLRQRMGLPLASLETIYECVGYRPYLEKMAVDIAVVDILWNGFSEAIRIANLCAVHGINVAPHNFYGPMADLIAANFSAVVPNLEIMEFEDDDVPWKYDLLTQPPIVVDGKMMLPAGVGWGADINETALKEHPWGGRA